jgi:hypothetical protein
MRRLAIRNPPIAKHHIDYSEFEHNKNSPNLLLTTDGAMALRAAWVNRIFLKRAIQGNILISDRRAQSSRAN